MAKKASKSKVQKTKIVKAVSKQTQNESPAPPAGLCGIELERWHVLQQDMLFPATKAAFKTKRLIVYSYKMRRSHEEMPRTLFFGMEKGKDFPRLIVCATVWLQQPLTGNYLEWLEVVASELRVGYATEFKLGLKKYLGGELDSTPVTESGKAFAQSFKKKEKK